MHRGWRLSLWILPVSLFAAGVDVSSASAQAKPAPAKTAVPGKAAPSGKTPAAGKTSPPAPTASAAPSGLPVATPILTDSDKADDLYRQAVEAGKREEWQSAYELLAEAVRLKQSHDILGNLGTAEFRLGRYRDAAEHFTGSLKLYPVNGRPEGKSFSQALLDEARTQVMTLTLKVTPATAHVRVNGREVGPADRDTVFVDAGDVTIEVGGVPGYESARQALKAEKGKEQTISIDLGPLGGDKDKPSWAVIGVGAGLAAVAAGVGIGLGAAAKGAESEWRTKGEEIKKTPGAGPCPAQPTSGLCKEANDAANQHNAFTGASIALFATAGALGAATLVYGLWPRKAPVRAGAAVTPGAVAFTLGGQF
ncbi:MAG: tetratricopeptide repeat protein [Polyangiaceae bacterium]